MKPRNDLTAEFVRSIIHYEPENGLFVWKKRWDHDASWNFNFSGKKSGYIAKNGYWRIVINYKQYLAHRKEFARVA